MCSAFFASLNTGKIPEDSPKKLGFIFGELPPPPDLTNLTPPPAIIEHQQAADQSGNVDLWGITLSKWVIHNTHCKHDCTDTKLFSHKIAAETYIRALLLDALENIEDVPLRERLKNSLHSDKELLDVLLYISPEQKIKICKELLRVESSETGVAQFLNSRLDNLFFYLDTDEKLQLFMSLEDSEKIKHATGLLRSSKSLSEFQRLCLDMSEKTPELNNMREFQELCDHQHLLGTFRVYADLLHSMIESDTLDEEKLLDIISLVKSVIVQSQGDSLAAEELWSSLQDTEHRIALDLLLDPKSRSEILTREALTLKMELLYGINISYGDSDLLTLFLRDNCGYHELGLISPEDDISVIEREILRWTSEELRQIEEVLQSIPFHWLHFTPMLRDIELVPSLGQGVLGARYHSDGRIKIAQVTRDNKYIEDHYEGVSSLKVVLAHEIAHGLQIGKAGAGYLYVGEGVYDFNKGEISMDFADYLELSGWTVYEPNRIEKGKNPWSIVIDGKEYPLDEPVLFIDKKVVFLSVPWAGLVISFDAEADFSSRWYAKTSPWEDFAEAYSEYLFLPHRLFRDAPEKFWHLELEMRLYWNDSRFYSDGPIAKP